MRLAAGGQSMADRHGEMGAAKGSRQRHHRLGLCQRPEGQARFVRESPVRLEVFGVVLLGIAPSF